MEVNYSLINKHLENAEMLLREYQRVGVAKCLNLKKIILDVDMGLGKTLISLTSTMKIAPKKVLIVCSKNAIPTWSKEVKKWFPLFAGEEYYTGVLGSAKKREALWQRDTLFHACTHLTFLSDREQIKKQKWDIVIWDEYHRTGIRNRQSKVFKALKPIALKAKYLFLLSGTPVSKGPQDLFAPLHAIDRAVFKSYWKFVETFCVFYEGRFGKEIIGAQNTVALNALLKSYMYRAKCSDPAIAAQMPELNRIPLYIELPKKFSKMYDKFEQDMVAEYADDKFMLAQNVLTRDIKLQQFLVCPKIIDPALPYGPYMETILDKIEESPTGLKHCVIFTPYRAAVDYLEEFLKSKGYTNVYKLWGGLSPDVMTSTVQGFKDYRNATDEEGKPSIMLCTTKTAQSFDLETSSTCYHMGYEWDQNDNSQAEGRLRRLINEAKVIRSFYLLSDKPIDARKMHVLGTKTENTNATFLEKTKGQSKTC